MPSPAQPVHVGDGLNTAGYAFAAPTTERQHGITFKVDQLINPKNRLTNEAVLGLNQFSSPSTAPRPT